MWQSWRAFQFQQALGLRFFVLTLLVLCVGVGCASKPHSANNDQKNMEFSEFDIVDEEKNEDPWEPFNRVVFSFNDGLDRAILKPVAKGYRAVTPNFVERGVSNFFSNLGEVSNVVNNILQWKWKKVGNDAGRLLLNSTIGLGGLIDVAGPAGLKKNEKETFGQTFSYWGIKKGPYLVLPFMGPSTLLDTGVSPLQWEVDPTLQVDHIETRVSLKALQLLDMRASLLSAEDLVSGDRYTFFREAYLQRREFLVNDGEVVDDFGGDFEDFEDEF